MREWFNILWTRLRALFRRESVLQDIEEELRIHIEMATEENLQRGLQPDEARAAALKSFGNPSRNKELGYDMRGGGWLEALCQDLHYGARMLRRNPGFTTVVVLTLALGIGANTAIFSVVHAVLWRALPYQQPEQLVMLWRSSTQDPAKSLKPSPNSPAMFLAWREHKDIFSDVAAYEDAAISHSPRFFLTGGNEPERIAGAYVSGNLFSLLGVKATLGRTFTIEEEEPGREQVVVLSDAFWRRRFGADPGVLGKSLHLNNKAYTVIGVLPPELELSYPKATELWTPLSFGPKERTDWNRAAYKVIARLKPGVTIHQAQGALSQLTQQLLAPHREAGQATYAQLESLHAYHFGTLQTPLYLLLAAVAALLLIACVNVANLSLARGMDRSREFAVRAALGAKRGRLFRQLLTESLMLAALGGAAGLLVAFLGRDLLVALMPKTVPRSGNVKLDAWVLSFTVLLSLSVGIVAGLLPALQVSRPNLNESLKAGARSATAQARTRLWHAWFVVVETALSLLLLIGAGLMIRSLWQLQHVELGFDPKNVLTMHFTIPPYQFNPDKTQKRAFVEAQEQAFIKRVVERVQQLPGVVSAAATASVPLRGVDYMAGFDIVGKPPGKYRTRFRMVSQDYFRTMGIRLLKGRLFTAQDTPQSGKVAVVTEEFVRKYLPHDEPLGQRLDPTDRNAEIIGVVADVRHQRPNQPLEPAMYLSLSQEAFSLVSLVIRTTGEPMQLAPAVRRAVWAENKDQPLEEIATMEQIAAASISDANFYSITLGAFALLALLLGALGLYSVVSYSVAQRTHEIGIRMALGAKRLDVLRLVLARGMKLTLLGIALGLLTAVGLTRLIKSLLFGVGVLDAPTFALVSLLLAAVGLLACYFPARRATQVDPLVALRHE
jgi:predicted permease